MKIQDLLAHGQLLDKAEKWSVETLEGITKSAWRLMCPLGQLKWAGHFKCLQHGSVLVLDFLPVSHVITCNFSALTISWTCIWMLKLFVGHWAWALHPEQPVQPRLILLGTIFFNFLKVQPSRFLSLQIKANWQEEQKKYTWKQKNVQKLMELRSKWWFGPLNWKSLNQLTVLCSGSSLASQHFLPEEASKLGQSATSDYSKVLHFESDF